ncbi:MAG: heavy-metal-associated domain-containing protein [Flavobacteriaceae bacterium]
MKRPYYYLLVILFVGCTTASKPEKKTVDYNEEETVELSADLSHISFPIEGMTCEVGCAARIEKKVAASEGVVSSKVDFEGKTAYVSFDPSATSFDAIRATVEGLGSDYKVGEAQASSPYFQLKEGKKCGKDCDKPCCKDKKTCDKSCEKKCCKDGKKDMDKKACAADCQKACCASKKEKA